MFTFAPCGCGSTICAVALGRESVESGCPAAVCLAVWLAAACEGCARGVFAVCCVLWHFPAFHSFRRSRVFGRFRHSFRRSAGVQSRFAALWGTFRLSTPSEGVGFPAVFATPSEVVQGHIRGLLRSGAHSRFLLLPKGSGFWPFLLLLPKE